MGYFESNAKSVFAGPLTWIFTKMSFGSLAANRGFGSSGFVDKGVARRECDEELAQHGSDVHSLLSGLAQAAGVHPPGAGLGEIYIGSIGNRPCTT